MNDKANLSAPWEGYARQLEALFEEDEGIEVRSCLDGDEKHIEVVCDDTDKAKALEALLPGTVSFGGVDVTITVVAPDVTKYSLKKLVEIAFKGNRVFRQAVEAGIGNKLTYGVLMPCVAQFWNDNLNNPHGLETKTFEEIAREVFVQGGAAGDAVLWTSDEL